MIDDDGGGDETGVGEEIALLCHHYSAAASKKEVPRMSIVLKKALKPQKAQLYLTPASFSALVLRRVANKAHAVYLPPQKKHAQGAHVHRSMWLIGLLTRRHPLLEHSMHMCHSGHRDCAVIIK